MKTLFETVFGSHAWGMSHEKSDVDIFRCYVMDSNKVLLGQKPETTFGREPKSRKEVWMQWLTIRKNIEMLEGEGRIEED